MLEAPSDRGGPSLPTITSAMTRARPRRLKTIIPARQQEQMISASVVAQPAHYLGLSRCGRGGRPLQ
jgi:hypothetical protein